MIQATCSALQLFMLNLGWTTKANTIAKIFLKSYINIAGKQKKKPRNETRPDMSVNDSTLFIYESDDSL